MALFGLLGLCQSLLGPLIVLFQADLGIGRTSGAWLVSGFFAGSVSNTLLCGFLGTRRMRPSLIYLFTALVLLGLVGLGYATTWPSLIASAIAMGLGFGGLALLVNTHMATHAGDKGFVLVSVTNGVFGVGATLGPILFGATLDWGRSSLLTAVAFVVALTAVPLKGLATGRSYGRPDARAEVTRLPATGNLADGSPVSLLAFCVLLFFYTALETGLSTWMGVHLRAEGQPVQTAITLTSVFWLGLACSRLFVPLVARRMPPQRLIVYALSASLGALVVISIPGGAYVGYLVTGFVAGPVFPATLAWVAKTAADPQRANAYVVASAMVGNVVSPVALGYAIGLWSLRALPPLVGVCVVIALLAANVPGRTRPSGSSSCRGGEKSADGPTSTDR